MYFKFCLNNLILQCTCKTTAATHLLLIVINCVLDKTLKDIRGMQLNNQKVFCAPGLRTKYFERLFCCSINYIYFLQLYHK